MTCKEAVYSEEVLDYIVGNYRGEDYILTLYNPVCYMEFDSIQGVVYQEPGSVTNETIEPYLDLYGQGVLIGFVDTGERVNRVSS